MANAGAGDDGVTTNQDEVIDGETSRIVEGIVSVDFAVQALRSAAVAAQGVAGAGVIVWGVLTYLQWHQFHAQGLPASQQAVGALEPFSYLILSALLGVIGFGCRLAANWIGLRLVSEYLDHDDSGTT